MSALTKKIEQGQPLGRRDTLRIGGTGCICSVPEYRESSKDGNDYKFLNVRVVSNSIRKNKDGSADQYSEFTDLVLSGNRAKALAGVLAKGQIVEFSGRLRSRSFDSKEYTNQQGNPAQIYRTEANIGMDGWINIMKDAAEGKGEKAVMDNAPAKTAQEPIAPEGIAGFGQMAAQFAQLMTQLDEQNKATASAEASAAAGTESSAGAEEIIDLDTTVDDDIPF